MTNTPPSIPRLAPCVGAVGGVAHTALFRMTLTAESGLGCGHHGRNSRLTVGTALRAAGLTVERPSALKDYVAMNRAADAITAECAK